MAALDIVRARSQFELEALVVTRAAEKEQLEKNGILPLLAPLAASFFCNFRHVRQVWWRKRVGVEPKL